MALCIAPVELADFDTFISEAATAPTPSDDLVAPPNPLAWPVTTSAEAEQRARRCFALQRRRVLEDPTTRFMKVVDDDTGATVAVARWHYYPDGYAYASEAAWEMAPLMSTKDDDDDDEAYPPPNFNVRLHNHILTERDSFRESWIPLGEPCWILMHLVTRPSQRRRGAAGMLVRWGMDRARETGAPAYLEAGVQGMPVYEMFGFVPVGDVRRVSLEGLGEVPGGLKEFVLVNMKWDPRVDWKGDE